MRPLELSLQGFTSFRTEQHVSFDELDLFAVTGPTGAGKSSLLDAMTYALYGHTMRSGKQDAELVSQGAAEMKVALRFLVRGEEYRITRTWRFRPSAPEVKVRLEASRNDKWEALETKDRAVAKRVEQIVGMDYDTFTRVILLPQGKFDEFLKGDAPKRRELLRQLGGYDVFERMRAEAAMRARAAKAERETLAAQLSAHLAPGAEELAAQAARLAEAEAARPGLEAAVRQAGQALDEQEKLFQHQERLQALRAALQALQGRAPEIAALRERLERSRQADRLQAPWARLEEARHQAQATAKVLAEARTRQATAEAGAAEAEAHFTAARERVELEEPALKGREQSLLTAKGLEDQRQVFAREAETARAQATARADHLAAATTTLNQANAQAERARAALQAAEQAAAEHVPAGPRLEALNELAPLIGEWNGLLKQAREEGARLKEARAGLAESQASLKAASEALERANATLARAREGLAEARAANEHHQAAALRAGLHAGDACPVCEGTFPGADALAPLAGGQAVDPRPLEAQEREADAAQRQAQQAYTRCEGFVAGGEQHVAELETTLARTKEAGAALRVRLNGVLDGEDWKIEDLEAERKELQERHARQQEIQERCRRDEAARREAEQAVAFKQEAVKLAEASHIEALELLKRQEARVGDIETQLNGLTGGRPVAELAAALERERALQARLLDAARQAHEKAQAARIEHTEAARQAERAAEAARVREAEDTASWADVLAVAELTEAEFLAARATPEEQAGWREAVEGYAAEALRLGTLEADVAALVGERSTSAAAIAACREAQETAQARLAANHQEAATLAAWLEGARERQREAGELQGRHDEAQAREQVYTTLGRDLRATDFQAYLLEHMQAELVARATVLLKELTDERYALIMRDGEFWIEDNWNGGEARRVRTLSGGETFATSLAMALALSERLSQGVELGSLFLDEGFGTLDPETLEAVTQILESLRQKNRLIGVITHVKALGERLPTQIRVSKSPRGSRAVVESP